MKILAINCKPDLSYFEKRGLHLDVEYKTIAEVFPLKSLYKIPDSNGQMVDLYSPWVEEYLEKNYKTFEYSIILVGWKPSDYSPVLKNTGGYTYWNSLKCGTFWSTVRQDTFPNNNYPIHELHHALCDVIYTLRPSYDISHIDFMDTDMQGRPYYLNDQPENPLSNYAQTWNHIIPYLPQLNAIVYAKPLMEGTLSRVYDWGNETVGKLEIGTFDCNTLELGFKNNQTNISAIPKGQYKVKWSFMPSRLSYHYQIMDVPGRSGVFFHSANLYNQLLGCVAVGKGYGDINSDKLPDILNSKITLKAFEDYMGKKDFILNII